MKNTRFENIVGIDISKDYFDVALLKNNKLEDSNKFSNDLKGFKNLISFLKSNNLNTNNVLICAEKTGIYSIRLSQYIVEKKYKLWLEDGIKIAKSEGFKRGKTDKIDAVRIAQYALRFQDKLQLWEPNEEIYDKMSHLFSLRERLIRVLGILEKPLLKVKIFLKKPFKSS